MNIPTFFKFLNRKIQKYDKMTSNPFQIPQPIILIWVEDYYEKDFYRETENN